MLLPLPITQFLASGVPVIDVRSPGEFEQGHIPGAVNVPLFSNDERAVVGTLYKQQSRDAAVLEGLRIVGPKLAAIVDIARQLAPDGRISVHCWRGGERSGSVAWLLDKAGFGEVNTLKGGYKAFRNHILGSFARSPDLLVLGGYTGTGKTEILHHLQELDEQVVDLEHLARHKGSSFGALGEKPQPSQEQFENLLWDALHALDLERPVWVEDESLMIGRNHLPAEFYAALRAAPVYFVDMPFAQREQRLVLDYGSYPREELADAVRRISKRLGPDGTRQALEALALGDLRTTARLSLGYYDKTYGYGLSKREAASVTTIPATTTDLRGLAKRLKDHVIAARTQH